MDARRHTSRTLSNEHQATLDLLSRSAKALAAPRAGDDAALRRTVAELDRHWRLDVERHFAFEERDLFPRMIESGEGDLATLLAEEHVTLRAVAADLLPLTAAAAAGSLDADGWNALRRHAAELGERLVAHIEKEESALVPLMDELLDDATDQELALAYAST